jgi:pimeloyl-ACP methyl ester carboxylesterase
VTSHCPIEFALVLIHYTQHGVKGNYITIGSVPQEFDFSTGPRNMSTIICIPSPPFGRYFWRDVCARFSTHQLATKIVTPFSEESDPQKICALIKKECDSIKGPIYILAHGSSIQIALECASFPNIAGIALTNGSFYQDSQLLKLAVSLPNFAMSILSQPKIAVALFRSSIGMRRWVVNPYVMNHDMVVTVCEEFISSSIYRDNCLKYIKEKPSSLQKIPQIRKPTLLIWGTGDYFHPIEHLSQHLSDSDAITCVNVPGGRYLHPIERPWETADSVHEWIETLK